jgi:glutamine cyclotransferase
MTGTVLNCWTTWQYETEGWGITHNGRCLIMSDGSDTLYFRDPDTFAEVGRITVQDQNGPVRLLNELEFINGEVWANIWQSTASCASTRPMGRWWAASISPAC